jgi:hypothetical protein
MRAGGKSKKTFAHDDLHTIFWRREHADNSGYPEGPRMTARTAFIA